MTKKITRTWKIEEDIAQRLDEWATRAHLPLGDSVQLGVWMLMSLNSDQRQMLLELMDERKEIQLNITVKPRRSVVGQKS